jgi:Spy/CpxP family protein refolding chaperone
LAESPSNPSGSDPSGSNPSGGLKAPRLGTVALLLSLALNIFVAGGFCYAQLIAPPKPAATTPQQPGPGPEKRLQMLVERLGIDPESSKPFKQLRRDLHAAQQVLAAKNHPLGEDYWEEMSGAQPDEKHLQDLIDQMNANRHEFQSTVTQVLVRFTATLTPEQRSELVKIIEDRTNPAGAPVRNSVGN